MSVDLASNFEREFNDPDMQNTKKEKRNEKEEEEYFSWETLAVFFACT